MLSKDSFGKIFLESIQFSEGAIVDGMNIKGCYFYRSNYNEKKLLESLNLDPAETLHNISEYIDGAFILVFVHSETQTIWAATDPYGLKRLYFKQSPNNTQLSDTLADFFDPNAPEIDKKGLQEYLRFLDISSPISCYKNIQVLDSASMLKISIENQTTEVYKKKDMEATPSNLTFEQAVNKVQKVFTNALENRLSNCINNRGKIGILLSGGIDSSLLTATIAQLGYSEKPDKLTAYTVGFPDNLGDESSIAVAGASHLKVDHKVLRFTIEEEYQAFFEIYSMMEFPFADPAVISTYLALKSMQQDGVTDVMEGTGADGIIGQVVPNYYKRLLKIDTFIPTALRKLLNSVLKSIGNPGSYCDYFDFEEIEEKFIRWKGWSRKEIEKISGEICDFSDTAFYQDFKKRRYASIVELSRIFMLPPDYRIIETVRLMGFNPVFPYHDQDFKQLILSIPDKHKHRGNETKALYRAILETMVPRNIWDVKKHGFNFPFEKLLLHKDADLVNRYIGDTALQQQTFFDKSMVREYRDKFLDGDSSLKFKIWALVVFQCWYEKHYSDLLSRA